MGKRFTLNQFRRTFGRRGMAEFGGAMFTYENGENAMSFSARGPLSEPLQLKV